MGWDAVSGASLAGHVLKGFDIGVMAGVLLFLRRDFHLAGHPWLEGALMSSIQGGALVGTLISGPLADRCGRRPVLLTAGALPLAAAFLMAGAVNPYWLIAARLLAGLGVGAVTIAMPSYVAECAPKDTRGSKNTIPQVGISLGILFSYLADFAVAVSTTPLWRVMLGLTAVPSAAFLALVLLYLPESPRWLLRQGRGREAHAAWERLEVLGLKSEEEVVPGALEQPLLKEAGADTESGNGGGPTKGPITATEERVSWAVLLFVIGLYFLQQASGVNAIVAYTPSILQQSGLADSVAPFLWGDRKAAAILATAVVYSPKLFAALFAMRVMDGVGRRRMLLCSIPLNVAALLTLSLATGFMVDGTAKGVLSMLSTSLFGCAFATGLGPVPVILATEIFPTSVRASCYGFCFAMHWLADAVVIQTFPLMRSHLGLPWTFAVFAISGVFAWGYVFVLVPHTDRKSLEEATDAAAKEIEHLNPLERLHRERLTPAE